MNLNHLFYFRALAQTENYTEAARLLMISQPSLSYAIKKLETDLDVPLFEKKGRNVVLTDYGKELYQAADEALTLIKHTTEKIQRKRKIESKQLSIGIVPTLVSKFFPEIVQKAQENGLNSRNYQVFHGFSSDILNKIEEEVYDVGLCSRIERSNMIFISAKKQPFILLVNHDFYKKHPNLKEEWFNMPLVTYRKTTPIGKTAKEVIDFYTEHPTIIEEFDDETSIGGFVSVNPSVAVVAKTSLLKQFDLIPIPLDEEKIYHTTYLAYLTKNQNVEGIKSLKKLIERYGDF